MRFFGLREVTGAILDNTESPGMPIKPFFLVRQDSGLGSMTFCTQIEFP